MDRAEQGWERLLSNPDVHLDGEYDALEMIRRWVFKPDQTLMPVDQFLYLDKPVQRT